MNKMYIDFVTIEYRFQRNKIDRPSRISEGDGKSEAVLAFMHGPRMHKRLHREMFPAHLCSNALSWFSEGRRHRINGPAYIYYWTDGSSIEEYYIQGVICE